MGPCLQTLTNFSMAINNVTQIFLARVASFRWYFNYTFLGRAAGLTTLYPLVLGRRNINWRNVIVFGNLNFFPCATLSSFGYIFNDHREEEDVSTGNPKKFSPSLSFAYDSQSLCVTSIVHWWEGGGGWWYLNEKRRFHSFISNWTGYGLARAWNDDRIVIWKG